MTAVDLKTADTAAAAKRTAVALDMAAVAAARHADDRLTSSQLATRCQWIAESFRGVDADTAADVAGDLLAYVGGRFGWTPRRSEVAGEWLKRWAIAILRRYTDDRIASLDADTAAGDYAGDDSPRSVLLEAERRAGNDHVTAAADPAAADLAAALHATPQQADAITCALSGWGSAIIAADAWGVSVDAAQKRIQRSRRAIRERWGNASAFAADVTAALEAIADPAADSGTLPLDVRPAQRKRTTAPRPAAAPPQRSRDVLRFIAAAERFTAPMQPAAGDRGTARDVLRFIDRTEVRAAIAAATPTATLPGRGNVKPHAAPLPDAWRGWTAPRPADAAVSCPLAPPQYVTAATPRATPRATDSATDWHASEIAGYGARASYRSERD